MIQQLQIHNYKCFADQTVTFAPLTMLVGANASGKSSVVQSLLLLRQSHNRRVLSSGQLLLAGSLTNVGRAEDVFNQDPKDYNIHFSVMYQEGADTFTYIYDEDQADAYQLTGKPTTYLEHTNLFDTSFNYLNAERVGPRLLYPIPTDDRWDYDVGTHGEYAPFVLGRSGLSEPIANAAAAVDEGSGEVLSHTIRNQSRLWMRQIVSDFEFDVKLLSDADQVRILFGNRGPNDLVRPTNIGFGLIYTLPIVVAALVAPLGSLLIVENPEAHLHPASQSAIGRFLARVAAAGVQVVIETHSDHVLNGIRRVVRDTLLTPESVAINYFVAAGESGPQRVIYPKMYANGGIRPWPKGFFDQFEKDLRKLL